MKIRIIIPSIVQTCFWNDWVNWLVKYIKVYFWHKKKSKNSSTGKMKNKDLNASCHEKSISGKKIVVWKIHEKMSKKVSKKGKKIINKKLAWFFKKKVSRIHSTSNCNRIPQ